MTSVLGCDPELVYWKRETGDWGRIRLRTPRGPFSSVVWLGLRGTPSTTTHAPGDRPSRHAGVCGRNEWKHGVCRWELATRREKGLSQRRGPTRVGRPLQRVVPLGHVVHTLTHVPAPRRPRPVHEGVVHEADISTHRGPGDVTPGTLPGGSPLGPGRFGGPFETDPDPMTSCEVYVLEVSSHPRKVVSEQ